MRSCTKNKWIAVHLFMTQGHAKDYCKHQEENDRDWDVILVQGDYYYEIC